MWSERCTLRLYSFGVASYYSSTRAESRHAFSTRPPFTPSETTQCDKTSCFVSFLGFHRSSFLRPRLATVGPPLIPEARPVHPPDPNTWMGTSRRIPACAATIGCLPGRRHRLLAPVDGSSTMPALFLLSLARQPFLSWSSLRRTSSSGALSAPDASLTSLRGRAITPWRISPPPRRMPVLNRVGMAGYRPIDVWLHRAIHMLTMSPAALVMATAHAATATSLSSLRRIRNFNPTGSIQEEVAHDPITTSQCHIAPTRMAAHHSRPPDAPPRKGDRYTIYVESTVLSLWETRLRSGSTHAPHGQAHPLAVCPPL
ncbi:hypothetical protein OH76DRAFT_1181880 [Lentinus brumalis]|uniref:Uncharacterized protein n=1 Tax=Lentinus brumalis TaxID=2498619 RepID=A0A371CTY0_9APHY|nr:hypothetical protein OH76DRAFT_1181880 [Polyporus brumalis]